METAETERRPDDTAHDPVGPVTSEIVEAYARDGAVWIPGLLSPGWMRLIAQGLERNVRNPGPNASKAFSGEPDEFLQDYCNYFVNPEYQRLLADSPIVDAMAKVIQTGELWLFTDQIFVKENRSRTTAWHQDIPWMMADGDKIATMWISLDPLSEEETLQCVAGSHRGPIYDWAGKREETGMEVHAGAYSASSAPPTFPDIDGDRGKWPIITHASQPGDVLIFRPDVIHGGGGMHDGGRRRTLGLRFFGDGTRFVDRPAGHEPEFPGVAEALKHGDPLRHPWFPQVYPRTSAA